MDNENSLKKLENGKKVYTIERVLGQGGFGITYLASGEIMDGNISRQMPYTIKEFFSEIGCVRQVDGKVAYIADQEDEMSNQRSNFIQEAKLLNEIHHEGIVPVNEYFDENNTSYYVMEYLGETSLTKYVAQKGGKLSEEEATQLIQKIAAAVDFLHGKKINHLDLKPDNVMMVSNRPVVIDFGCCQRFGRFHLNNRTQGSHAASAGYSPLEQYSGIDKFSPKVDIYALGATFFYMLTGEAPCNAIDMSEQYLTDHLPEGLSARCQMALINSLQRDEKQRMESVQEFLRTLKPQSTVAPEQKPKAAPVSAPDSKTVLIGAEKTKNTDSSKSKKVGMILGTVLVLLIVCGLIALEFIPKSSTPTEPETVQQDTVAQPQDVQSDTTSASAVETKEATPSTEEVKKENEVTTTTSGGNKPVATTPKATKTDLGYATWSGKVVNGQPQGDGILILKQSHTLKGQKLRKGDRVDAQFKNGTLVRGFLERGDSVVIL